MNGLEPVLPPILERDHFQPQLVVIDGVKAAEHGAHSVLAVAIGQQVLRHHADIGLFAPKILVGVQLDAVLEGGDTLHLAL